MFILDHDEAYLNHNNNDQDQIKNFSEIPLGQYAQVNKQPKRGKAEENIEYATVNKRNKPKPALKPKPGSSVDGEGAALMAAAVPGAGGASNAGLLGDEQKEYENLGIPVKELPTFIQRMKMKDEAFKNEFKVSFYKCGKPCQNESLLLSVFITVEFYSNFT